jgi:excisionase family DNA binding protein
MKETKTRAVAADFLSIQEAAELLRVSPVTIKRYLWLKKLTRYKVGTRTLLDRQNVLSIVRQAE